MDLFFLALLVVLTLVLLAAHVLNNVTQTNDLLKVFNTLLQQNPSTVAFSLGYDRQHDKYRNVYTRPVAHAKDSGRIEAYVSWERNPVNTDGKYVVVVNSGHGRITDKSNGFEVAGVNSSQFTCPDGYEGSRCQTSRLCTEEDCASAKTKPLTYTQFNALNLYKNTFARTTADLIEESEPTHPRIRIQCLENGSHELQTCPDNKLLDSTTMQCREYDLCQDRINGYKHNYRVDDWSADLQNVEYYLCVDNKSVLKKCKDRTVFSMANQGCIVESVCFNRGKDQIAVDHNNYIQCRADTGRKVYCEHGVQKNGNVLSCKTKTCKPYTLRYDDGTLNFVYGQNVCDDRDNGTLTICDRTSIGKSYSYRWAEEFQLSLSNWPTAVLDETTQTCVAPTDDIIVNTATVELAWSSAMNTGHKFNIRKQEYVCAEGQYRWDYIAGVVVPAPASSDMFIDAAAPCQTTAVPKENTVWWSLANSSVGAGTVLTFPPDTTPPLVYAVHLKINYDTNFWPVYDVKSKKYTGSVCTYDSKTKTHTITEYTDTIPPLGFARVETLDCVDKSTVPITLIGYTAFHVNVLANYKAYMYYFVASGKTESLRFSMSAQQTVHRIDHNKDTNAGPQPSRDSNATTYRRLH